MRLLIAFSMLALSLAGPAVAGGGSCLPSCEVQSHLLAFVPPVTFVEQGSTLEWTALDIGHAAADGVSASPPGIGTCFFTDFGPSSRGSATFYVMDGRLYAASEMRGGAVVECEHATASPDGTFVLDYICPWHNRMVGKLVIR